MTKTETIEKNLIITGPITDIKQVHKNNNILEFATLMQKDYYSENKHRYISIFLNPINDILERNEKDPINIGDYLKVNIDVTTSPAVDKDGNAIKRKDGTQLININGKINKFKIVSRGIEMDEDF